MAQRTKKCSENPFSMVHNGLISDDRLSWKARGLMIFMLSKPDDWEFNYTHLQKQAPDGQKSLTSGINELKKYGYLVVERTKRENKFEGAVWHITEDPINYPIDTKKPINTPYVENAYVGNAYMQNAHYSNTELSNTDYSNTLTDFFSKEVVDVDWIGNEGARRYINKLVDWTKRERAPTKESPKQIITGYHNAISQREDGIDCKSTDSIVYGIQQLNRRSKILDVPISISRKGINAVFVFEAKETFDIEQLLEDASVSNGYYDTDDFVNSIYGYDEKAGLNYGDPENMFNH